MKSKSILLLSLPLLFACSTSPASSSSLTPSEEEPSSSSLPSTESQSSSSESQSSSTPSSSQSQSSSSESSSSLPQEKASPFKEKELAKQVYLNNIGDIYSVWDCYRGKGTTLAIIDTGFDLNHPEFFYKDGTSKILDSSAYFAKQSDGSVKVSKGKENAKIRNGDSHGTFCATIAAGTITGEGIVGIAPEASLMLLAVDSTPASICEAFRYAADNGADVLTISIGSYNSDKDGDLVNDGSDLSTIFNDSLAYASSKNLIVCSAAGNGGLYSPSRASEPTYPGACDHVIACGGLSYNSSGTIWSGSTLNGGSAGNFIEVFAPSDNMYAGAFLDGKSTYAGGWQGTSFASPIVAGAACLYKEKNPNATPSEFETALKTSARSIDSGERGLDVGKLLGVSAPLKERTITFMDASWWSKDGASSSVYLWSEDGKSTTWPGLVMTKESYYWKTTVPEGYDYCLFARVSSEGEFWGAQSINLRLSLFDYCTGYSVSSSTESWSAPVRGSFVGTK